MYKIGGAVLLVVAAFLGGFYTGKGQREVITTEVRGETRVEYRDRIVTVTKTVKPDGTVTETTTTQETSKDTTSTTTDKSNTIRSKASNYSVGLKYSTQYSDIVNMGGEKLEATLGRRLVGDIWLEAGAGMRSASLGIRVQF